MRIRPGKGRTSRPGRQLDCTADRFDGLAGRNLSAIRARNEPRLHSGRAGRRGQRRSADGADCRAAGRRLVRHHLASEIGPELVGPRRCRPLPVPSLSCCTTTTKDGFAVSQRLRSARGPGCRSGPVTSTVLARGERRGQRRLHRRPWSVARHRYRRLRDRPGVGHHSTPPTTAARPDSRSATSASPRRRLRRRGR